MYFIQETKEGQRSRRLQWWWVRRRPWEWI